MEAHIEAVEILGVPVARLTASEALDEIARLGSRASPSLIAYANAHTLNLASRDASFAGLLRRAGLVLNDGSGVGIAARLKRKPFPENLNGSDFNPRILELAARSGWSAFFLGARPGVAERAARIWQERMPGLDVAGAHHGYFDDGGAVAEMVAASGAGMVMVALGNPLQERWLAEHLARTGASLGIGVGAFFDFSTGEVPRAPAWMNRFGVEWVYRLGREPRRMWRRYLVGNPAFLARVAIDLLRSRSSAH